MNKLAYEYDSKNDIWTMFLSKKNQELISYFYKIIKHKVELQ